MINASIYRDGKYSDLTVVCGERTYRAHKVLLCTRSQFFAKACDGGFQVRRKGSSHSDSLLAGHVFDRTDSSTVSQEASTGVIDLSQDDPQAVKMMMHYFYHLDYPHVPMHEHADITQSAPSENEVAKPSLSGPFPYQTAPVIFTATRRIATPSGTRGKKNLGSKPATPWFDLDIDDEIRDPNLIIHAKVYALGEQYAIEGLKAVALEKFAAEAQVHWATEDFLRAVEHVYSSTPEHDRGLRDVVIDTFYERRREMMYREDVTRYLRDAPDLAYDVLMHLYKEVG